MIANFIDGCVSRESRLWNFAEELSCTSPIKVRLVAPVTIVGSAALRCIAIVATGFKEARENYMLSLCVVPLGYYIAIKPAVKIVANLVSLVFFMLLIEASPRKYIKCIVFDFNEKLFIKVEKEKLSSFGLDPKSLMDIITCIKKRHVLSVRRAESAEELDDICFLDTKESKNIVLNEIQMKAEKIKRARLYCDTVTQKTSPFSRQVLQAAHCPRPSEQSVCHSKKDLDKNFKKFEARIKGATMDEAQNMSFAPCFELV